MSIITNQSKMNFSEKKYYSVLRNTNKAVVNDYPYPHVIIRDA